ncbi:hypothetical protein H310_14012 [Aphanomyces invadans]|uniref:Uncharacterized protein n=1 Tax=Aphanomyces invadans TaxID=157072 RepID=A0A024TDU5_9STRA|nr:hypothetical protein H310_14012 [Aphanomyces invadans]ETV91492.1 hypothetical protein H310_14012 [Aphanomyces invadans]|eukprot:XP_008879944.1 hypothetical protein H310_14012 [Aphanomyces invadans]
MGCNGMHIPIFRVMNATIIEAAAWECKAWGDSVSAFRVHLNSNLVECYSNNGRDCLWVTSMDVCRSNLVAADGKMVAQPLKPLRCGPMYLEVWGMTGNDQPGHWCNSMYPSLKLESQAGTVSSPAGVLRITMTPLPLTPGETAVRNHDTSWPQMLTGASVFMAVAAIGMVLFMWRKTKHRQQHLVDMTAKAPAYQLKQDSI